MKIGFDFDKIFIDYPPFLPARLFDKFYKKRDNGILLYRIPGKGEQFLRKLLHLPFMRPLIKENFSVLKKITKKKNKLYLISSRYKFLEPETNKLIKKYQLDKIFDKMYFNYHNEQPHKFKDRVLQELQLDQYFDDDLSLITHVMKKNNKTKFFWVNHTGQTKAHNKKITEIQKLKDFFH